ncbi:MAG: hypothetical protein KDK78_06575, partial [Chlamydiia bacterium]|nr:hypothetical protein [Chlamydiia bacterium]
MFSSIGGGFIRSSIQNVARQLNQSLETEKESMAQKLNSRSTIAERLKPIISFKSSRINPGAGQNIVSARRSTMNTSTATSALSGPDVNGSFNQMTDSMRSQYSEKVQILMDQIAVRDQPKISTADAQAFIKDTAAAVLDSTQHIDTANGVASAKSAYSDMMSAFDAIGSGDIAGATKLLSSAQTSLKAAGVGDAGLSLGVLNYAAKDMQDLSTYINSTGETPLGGSSAALVNKALWAIKNAYDSVTPELRTVDTQSALSSAQSAQSNVVTAYYDIVDGKASSALKLLAQAETQYTTALKGDSGTSYDAIKQAMSDLSTVQSDIKGLSDL